MCGMTYGASGTSDVTYMPPPCSMLRYGLSHRQFPNQKRGAVEPVTTMLEIETMPWPCNRMQLILQLPSNTAVLPRLPFVTTVPSPSVTATLPGTTPSAQFSGFDQSA